MRNTGIDEEVIVHPVGGMQLSEGRISGDEQARFRGCLPGIETLEGGSVEEVLKKLEIKAKAYYGDDVVVELISHASTAC
ncbi:MAG TPA: hypothetical protein VIR77_05640 [Pontiella sp.]